MLLFVCFFVVVVFSLQVLSRAFRNRFIELHFEDIPVGELVEILHRRCLLPRSYAEKMVRVMKDLQVRGRERKRGEREKREERERRERREREMEGGERREREEREEREREREDGGRGK